MKFFIFLLILTGVIGFYIGKWYETGAVKPKKPNKKSYDELPKTPKSL